MRKSEYLTEARGHIENGWIQGNFQSHEGVCAVGALFRAHSYCGMESQDYWEVRDALSERAREMAGRPALRHLYDVAAFNDETTTTKQDVLNLFDKTISSFQERGE